MNCGTGDINESILMYQIHKLRKFWMYKNLVLCKVKIVDVIFYASTAFVIKFPRFTE